MRGYTADGNGGLPRSEEGIATAAVDAMVTHGILGGAAYAGLD